MDKISEECVVYLLIPTSNHNKNYTVESGMTLYIF